MSENEIIEKYLNDEISRLDKEIKYVENDIRELKRKERNLREAQLELCDMRYSLKLKDQGIERDVTKGNGITLMSKYCRKE